jgi:hypothetical protein
MKGAQRRLEGQRLDRRERRRPLPIADADEQSEDETVTT